MRKKLSVHILSILFVFLVFSFSYFLLFEQETSDSIQQKQNIKEMLFIDFIDFDNALHKALLTETVNVFYPQDSDSLLNAIELYYDNRENQNTVSYSKNTPITWETFSALFFMYLKFVFVFILVLGVTYYGVQTLGTMRFVLKKQNKPSLYIRAYNEIKNISPSKSIKEKIKAYFQSASLIAKALFKTVAYLLLFAPAYVIAYSIKTKFDTDSILFMILLGVISNGLLITYVQKFYTFLVSESRKGYVETAIVKNLENDYSFNTIKLSSIFNIKKKFPGHVFNHIYMNARHQYLGTLKEQAAFLISGLIIIEMALNIHNHLSYELLQNLLYENYIVVLCLLFAIYLTVKITEIIVDYRIHIETIKYSNK
ncbi:hypothetical protein ACFLSX_00070 [Calditrichota bacterium]